MAPSRYLLSGPRAMSNMTFQPDTWNVHYFEFIHTRGRSCGWYLWCSHVSALETLFNNVTRARVPPGTSQLSKSELHISPNLNSAVVGATLRTLFLLIQQAVGASRETFENLLLHDHRILKYSSSPRHPRSWLAASSFGKLPVPAIDISDALASPRFVHINLQRGVSTATRPE